MDETKRPEEQRKLAEVIAEKINVLNELGDSEDMDQIIVLVRHLCGNLRFADGRSLEDVMKEQKLRKNLNDTAAGEEPSDEYGDEESEEEVEEIEEEEGEEESDSASDSLYDEIEEEERQ